MGKDAADSVLVQARAPLTSTPPPPQQHHHQPNAFKALRWWERASGLQYAHDASPSNLASRALLSATILSFCSAAGIIVFAGWISGIHSVRACVNERCGVRVSRSFFHKDMVGQWHGFTQAMAKKAPHARERCLELLHIQVRIDLVHSTSASSRPNINP